MRSIFVKPKIKPGKPVNLILVSVKISLSSFKFFKSDEVVGMVVHACNPAIWELEVGAAQGKTSSGKVGKTLPQKYKSQIQIKGLGVLIEHLT